MSPCELGNLAFCCTSPSPVALFSPLSLSSYDDNVFPYLMFGWRAVLRHSRQLSKGFMRKWCSSLLSFFLLSALFCGRKSCDREARNRAVNLCWVSQRVKDKTFVPHLFFYGQLGLGFAESLRHIRSFLAFVTNAVTFWRTELLTVAVRATVPTICHSAR